MGRRKHKHKQVACPEFNFTRHRVFTKDSVELEPGRFFVKQNFEGSYSVVNTCDECQIVLYTTYCKKDEDALNQAQYVANLLNENL